MVTCKDATVLLHVVAFWKELLTRFIAHTVLNYSPFIILSLFCFGGREMDMIVFVPDKLDII